jgi:hypothetical protein
VGRPAASWQIAARAKSMSKPSHPWTATSAAEVLWALIHFKLIQHFDCESHGGRRNLSQLPGLHLINCARVEHGAAPRASRFVGVRHLDRLTPSITNEIHRQNRGGILST